MSWDRFDDSSERQRHEKLDGRAVAGPLAQLDRLLVDSETDHWVAITGGSGMSRVRFSRLGWRGARIDPARRRRIM
jgi:hypothetical protein